MSRLDTETGTWGYPTDFVEQVSTAYLPLRPLYATHVVDRCHQRIRAAEPVSRINI